MTSKQRAYLRGLISTQKPIFQIGKGGINDNQITAIADSLEALELIKITALKTVEDTSIDIASKIAELTDSEVVQVIGNKITLYKRSTKKPKIELPN